MPHAFDPSRVRADFPLLATRMRGKPIVYLDNAATTQKPTAVLETIDRYYKTLNANVHRGVYQLSQEATDAYEGAREKVRRFINAAEVGEVIYTRGTTEGVNLVAHSWGRSILKPGDEVLVSTMEHHSNIVPWQLLCQATGARLRAIPINDDGELRLNELASMLSGRTKMVALVHVSNSLGTVNPIKQLIHMAQQVGAVTLVDGAQAAAHMPIDVRDLGCDFYAFSGHKLYGPTGIGILYGRRDRLEAMPPFLGGGDMISSVTFEKTTWNELPYKFEAGTPHIEGAIGLGAAIDYVTALGLENIQPHEADILDYATEKLGAIDGLRIIGNARSKAGAISFLIEGLSHQDVGLRLDMEGIAIRTGHHCCQPVMDRFGITGTARASFAMYTTRQDIDALAAGLKTIAADGARAAERKATAPHPTGPLQYPQAAGPTPQAVADEIAETFEFLEDWQQHYQYLIELGEKLPPMPDALKTEANRVHGCQSTVHLSARTRPGTTDVMEFLADSDADIVRGLVGLLEKLYSGQKAAEILAFDVQGYFTRLGLDAHLSMTRRNGLFGMVKRVRGLAAEMTEGSASHARA